MVAHIVKRDGVWQTPDGSIKGGRRQVLRAASAPKAVIEEPVVEPCVEDEPLVMFVEDEPLVMFPSDQLPETSADQQYEDQGTGYDPGAVGHELQGRKPEPEVPSDDVADVDAHDDRKKPKAKYH